MGENPRFRWENPASPSGSSDTLAEVGYSTRHSWARFFSLTTLVVGLVYLGWLGRLLLLSRSSLDVLFFLAEALSYLLLCLLCYNTWSLQPKSPENPPNRAPFSVDILVPCCGEPLEVISTTLKAVQRINYHPLDVYVLDDGASPAVAALAQACGFRYLSRTQAGETRQDAKSGNLNFGLNHSCGDVVLVLDADQVPSPDILEHLVPMFQRPRLGYVQSKQAFYLPEGDPFYNSDKVFYDTIQLHNDQANAVISCGSGVMYRRQALQEMGGFTTWNLLEDFTTSYELVSRGWDGAYYPQALSRGLAPTTLAGVYRQRSQWCLDTMRVFFWDNPLFKAGLSWVQKTRFLFVMMSYLASGLVFPLFYTVPLLVYLSGRSCIIGDELTYGILRGLYLVFTVCMFYFLFWGKEPLRQFKMLCCLFPVHALAILAALLYPPGRKPAYRVNNEGALSPVSSWWHLAPHLGFISLHLSLPVAALMLGWCSPRLVFFNSLFSAMIIWILGDLVWAVVLKPRWHPAMDPRRVYG
jgi:cellulose synthase (UDP-forming)